MVVCEELFLEDTDTFFHELDGGHLFEGDFVVCFLNLLGANPEGFWGELGSVKAQGKVKESSVSLGFDFADYSFHCRFKFSGGLLVHLLTLKPVFG